MPKSKPKSRPKSRQAKKKAIAKIKAKPKKIISRTTRSAKPKTSKTIRKPKNNIKKVVRAKNVIKKTPKQKKIKKVKLTKAKAQKQRSFRKGVSLLKKLGIAFRGKKKVVQNKVNEKKIKQFAPIIQGKAKAYKVSAKEAKAYKKTGNIVVDGFLMLPKKIDTDIEKLKSGHRETTKMPGGSIERVIIPVEYKNLKQYLTAAYKDKGLQALNRKGAKFAFRFFGNNSLSTFENLDDMIEYLGYYESVHEAIASGKASEMLEVYKNIEIVTVKQTKAWFVDMKKRDKEKGDNFKGRKENHRSKRDRIRYAKMKLRNPQRLKYQSDRRALNAQRWYDRNKNNKAFLKKRAAQRRRDRKKQRKNNA